MVFSLELQTPPGFAARGAVVGNDWIFAEPRAVADPFGGEGNCGVAVAVTGRGREAVAVEISGFAKVRTAAFHAIALIALFVRFVEVVDAVAVDTEISPDTAVPKPKFSVIGASGRRRVDAGNPQAGVVCALTVEAVAGYFLALINTRAFFAEAVFGIRVQGGVV
jgi:hypothetical protein